MPNIQAISDIDAFFVGRGANDAFQALIDIVDEIRECVNDGPQISGGYRISVREDQGFTVSLEEDALGEAQAGGNAVMVVVQQDGGSQFVPPSQQASWTYTVNALNGDFLGSSVPQERDRPMCNINPTNEFGIGFYTTDSPPVFKLWDAGEVPNVFQCEPPVTT